MIRLLDAQTVGKIAAGEIVERPVSVVKELVENAVDAGARRIEVRLEGGGVDAIEVIDDGCGIAVADLPLAVCRHATSKLAVASDLESIDTLGFRGEGLASIAAVAQLEITSRRAGEEIGARIVAHEQMLDGPQAAAAPPGTSVRLRDLFANVPVRREYLRTASAELNRISAWLSTFALAYPGITFALHHDGRELWVLPATADERARLASVFGKEAAQALIPLQETGAALSGALRGFVSAPGNDRTDRRMQILFVNGRLLRSTLLAGAWTAGYATFAMSGRQPYGVLFLSLPPEHVDPNVHPTKSDVRLRFGHQVFEAVKRAIASTLAAHASARFRESVPRASDAVFAPAEASAAISLLPEIAHSELPVYENGSSQLRVLAQIDLTYFLATDGRALVLIDQHAAHERVAYERIVASAAGQAPSEPLLIPLIVELDAVQSSALDRAIGLLREGGVEIEPFGERIFRITATPAGYGARSFDVRGFVDDLTEDPKQRDVRERVWASLACHSVARAGERLHVEEMQHLLERLQQCDNPMHCPHGRPTIVRMESDAIAKLFKRL